MSAVAKENEEDVGLEALFERHHAALWRLALRLVGEREAARDLVQETFVRAATRRLPEDLRSAEAWLVRTLVNLSRDLHRWRQVRRAHARTADATATPRPGGDESRVVARLTVERALDRLPPRRRAILVMRELEGLETRRVAELLGLRPATVRWHLAAARRAIRRWLEASREREDG